MADTLTSRQIIQKPDILIDPNYATPPGVTEARPSEGTSQRRTSGSDDAEMVILDEPWSPGGPPGQGSLVPPSGLAIESQKQSYNADGSFAIDAVLTFDSVPGATRYEVRIAKTA